MISEAVLSIWKSNWRSGALFLISLAAIGVISFYENDDWQRALRVPVSILAFSAMVVTAIDFIMWVFVKEKIGLIWCVFAVASGGLFSLLFLFGNPVPLALLALFVAIVILGVSCIKSIFVK